MTTTSGTNNRNALMCRYETIRTNKVNIVCERAIYSMSNTTWTVPSNAALTIWRRVSPFNFFSSNIENRFIDRGLRVRSITLTSCMTQCSKYYYADTIAFVVIIVIDVRLSVELETTQWN